MKELIRIVIFLSVFVVGCSMAYAGQKYTGANPPSINIVQQNINEYREGKTVVGLHKEGEGAYQIITNKNQKEDGGPYSLVRLESNEWMINFGRPYEPYVFINLP